MLLDERGVLETMYRYGHALDYGDDAGFLDCFTESGIWASTSRWGTAPRHFEGRAELVRFFTGHTHAPALYHKHLLVEPRVTVEGDVARVDSYFVRVDESATGPYLRSFGRYKDRLVRCPDGRWRFAERRIESESGRPAPPS